MPEFRRYILTNQCYFVTTRVLNGEPIFKSRELCLLLIDNLKFYREKMQFKIFGYVIMPDHFHGLIKPQGSVIVSDIMGSIKSYSSKQIAEVCGREGSLWQSRFYEHVTRSEQESSCEKVRAGALTYDCWRGLQRLEDIVPGYELAEALHRQRDGP